MGVCGCYMPRPGGCSACNPGWQDAGAVMDKLKELRERVEVLEAALRWYADPDNYSYEGTNDDGTWGGILLCHDAPDRARAALNLDHRS